MNKSNVEFGESAILDRSGVVWDLVVCLTSGGSFLPSSIGGFSFTISFHEAAWWRCIWKDLSGNFFGPCLKKSMSRRGQRGAATAP